MATHVTVELDDEGRLVVRKVALTGDDRDRRAEADWLRRANGRGVVRLVASVEQSAGVVTAHAGSHSWRTAAPGPVAARPLVASLLGTVAELHRRGLVHGALCADHLVLGPDGIRLCSPRPGTLDPVVDRLALADLLDAAMAGWQAEGTLGGEGGRWNRVVDLLRHAGSGWPLDDVAALLEDPAPTAGTGVADRPHRGRRAATGAVAVVGLAALAGVAAVVTGPLTGSGPDSSVRSAAPPSAAALRPVTGDQRDRSDGPGDVLVTTDRACSGSPGAAVLDPATGTVWAFPDLPGRDDAVVGVAVARVEGAAALVLVEDAGCQRLVVHGPGGEAEVPLPGPLRSAH
jgi:hypothetical protein